MAIQETLMSWTWMIILLAGLGNSVVSLVIMVREPTRRRKAMHRAAMAAEAGEDPATKCARPVPLAWEAARTVFLMMFGVMAMMLTAMHWHAEGGGIPVAAAVTWWAGLAALQGGFTLGNRAKRRFSWDRCAKCGRAKAYYLADTGITLRCSRCRATWQAGTSSAGC